MRVELTDHITDNTGAFLEAGIGIELEDAHGMENAPVNGFQSVAHIRQGAAHDGGQRIGQIALFKRGFQINGLDVVAIAARARNQVFSHGHGLNRASAHDKCAIVYRDRSHFIAINTFVTITCNFADTRSALYGVTIP